MTLRSVHYLKTLRGFAAIMALLCLTGPGWAQTSGDTTLLEMREAFRRGNTTTLATLLPQVRGHVLEPLASYWEARSRLDTATPEQMRAALARHPGSYWEDRLRNDWLLHLGKQRDWTNFSAGRGGAAGAATLAAAARCGRWLLHRRPGLARQRSPQASRSLGTRPPGH
jgi:soluble lytic murein transglycosylase